MRCFETRFASSVKKSPLAATAEEKRPDHGATIHPHEQFINDTQKLTRSRQIPGDVTKKPPSHRRLYSPDSRPQPNIALLCTDRSSNHCSATFERK